MKTKIKHHYVLVDLSYSLRKNRFEPSENYLIDRKISVWECNEKGDAIADTAECSESAKNLILDKNFSTDLDVCTEGIDCMELGSFVAEAIKLKNNLQKLGQICEL